MPAGNKTQIAATKNVLSKRILNSREGKKVDGSSDRGGFIRVSRVSPRPLPPPTGGGHQGVRDRGPLSRGSIKTQQTFSTVVGLGSKAYNTQEIRTHPTTDRKDSYSHPSYPSHPIARRPVAQYSPAVLGPSYSLPQLRAPAAAFTLQDQPLPRLSPGHHQSKQSHYKKDRNHSQANDDADRHPNRLHFMLRDGYQSENEILKSTERAAMTSNRGRENYVPPKFPAQRTSLNVRGKTGEIGRHYDRDSIKTETNYLSELPVDRISNRVGQEASYSSSRGSRRGYVDDLPSRPLRNGGDTSLQSLGHFSTLSSLGGSRSRPESSRGSPRPQEGRPSGHQRGSSDHSDRQHESAGIHDERKRTRHRYIPLRITTRRPGTGEVGIPIDNSAANYVPRYVKDPMTEMEYEPRLMSVSSHGQSGHQHWFLMPVQAWFVLAIVLAALLLVMLVITGLLYRTIHKQKKKIRKLVHSSRCIDPIHHELCNCRRAGGIAATSSYLGNLGGTLQHQLSPTCRASMMSRSSRRSRKEQPSSGQLATLQRTATAQLAAQSYDSPTVVNIGGGRRLHPSGEMMEHSKDGLRDDTESPPPLAPKMLSPIRVGGCRQLGPTRHCAPDVQLTTIYPPPDRFEL